MGRIGKEEEAVMEDSAARSFGNGACQRKEEDSTRNHSLCLHPRSERHDGRGLQGRECQGEGAGRRPGKDSGIHRCSPQRPILHPWQRTSNNSVGLRTLLAVGLLCVVGCSPEHRFAGGGTPANKDLSSPSVILMGLKKSIKIEHHVQRRDPEPIP